MIIEIYGKIDRPIYTVAGTWDPFIKYFSIFFQELYTQAIINDCVFCPIIFDPKPVNLRAGYNRIPTIDSLDYRISQILSSGIKAVIHVSLNSDDINNGIDFFISELNTFVQIKVFCIGPNQSFGPMEKGNHTAVANYCNQMNIFLKKIAYDTRFIDAGKAVNLVMNGKFEEAVQMIGHVPDNKDELIRLFKKDSKSESNGTHS